MRNPEKTDLVFETIATSSKTVRTSGKWESQNNHHRESSERPNRASATRCDSACACVLEKGAGQRYIRKWRPTTEGVF